MSMFDNIGLSPLGGEIMCHKVALRKMMLQREWIFYMSQSCLSDPHRSRSFVIWKQHFLEFPT